MSFMTRDYSAVMDALHIHPRLSETHAYGYDRVGNRRVETTNNVSQWADYNGLNQLVTKQTAAGDVNYGYDQNGNQISETVPNSLTIARSFDYDVDNRLTEAKTGSTSINTNTYRGDGQRISKTENGTKTNYVYLGDSVLYTTDMSNHRTGFNFYAPGGGLVASKRYSGTQAGRYLSYAKDIRTSTSAVLDDSGAYLLSYDYSDFGETTRNGDQTILNEIAYTGGIYDASTELYYLNARYYDPSDGCFLTMDTARNGGGISASFSLYGYCEGDPIDLIDPSGHYPMLPIPAIAATKSLIAAYKAAKSTTRLSSKQRKNHKAYNEGIEAAHPNWFKGFTNGQSRIYIKSIKVGNYTTDYNGCGWIAVHNAMLMFKKEKGSKPSEIVYDLENGGLVLKGKFGTNIFALQKYLKKYGIKGKFYTGTAKKLEKKAKKAKASILLYFWKSKKKFDLGGHYIAMRPGKAKGSHLIGFNRGNYDVSGGSLKASLKKYLKKENGFAPCLLTLRK